MPKMRCPCGYVVNLSQVPCPDERETMHVSTFAGLPSLLDPVILVDGMLGRIVECPRCSRLGTHWHGVRYTAFDRYAPARTLAPEALPSRITAPSPQGVLRGEAPAPVCACGASLDCGTGADSSTWLLWDAVAMDQITAAETADRDDLLGAAQVVLRCADCGRVWYPDWTQSGVLEEFRRSLDSPQENAVEWTSNRPLQGPTVFAKPEWEAAGTATMWQSPWCHANVVIHHHGWRLDEGDGPFRAAISVAGDWDSLQSAAFIQVRFFEPGQVWDKLMRYDLLDISAEGVHLGVATIERILL